MFVLLFFFALFITTYAIYHKTRQISNAFVWSSLIIGVAIIFNTEVSSLFGLFTSEVIFLFWLLYCLMVIVTQKLWRDIPALPKLNGHFILGLLFLFLTLTFLNALISPPTTYDSMTYHMARVVYWEQYGSISHYPTSELRQLYQHPFAEYVIAQLQLLSNSDQFANLPQWFSYLGCLILLFLISQQLGANKRQQWVSVGLGATIPMAIFQATSTQNDMVTAYYVMCSIYFSLILRQKITLSALIGLGISVGIALLTKGTAYIYLAPLLLWVTLSLLLKEHFKAIYKLSIAGSIAIILIAPHFLRNLSTFNSLTGPHSELYTNDTVSLAYTTSNILRNIGLNYSAPINAPSLILASQQIGAVFVAIHQVLGLPLNDTGSTWSATRFFFPVISLVPFGEDAAPAPIHVSLIIVALFVIAYKRKFSLLAQYSFVCVGVFILFSLILKWQAWHTRLHLPMLMASMPFVAIALNKLLMWAMLALVFIFGIVWLLMTPNRSFITPNMSQSVLFAPRTQLQGITDSYLDLSRNALQQGCPIGFYFRGDTPVYLFLNALKQLSPNDEFPETGYVFIKGAETYNPCVLIANIPLPEAETTMWQSILQLDGFNLWVKLDGEQAD